MPSILIDSDSCCDGEQVAAKTASAVGGRLVGEELFEQAAERYDLALNTLRKAFFQGPTLLSLSEAARRRGIACVRAALASELLTDQVVYHGPMGHLLIAGISHVIRVRVTGRLEERLARLMQRDGVSEPRARKLLAVEGEQRSWLAREFFRVEWDSPELYDLMLDRHASGVDGVVAAMEQEIARPKYRQMSYSAQSMADLELEARATAQLLAIQPDLRVQARAGALLLQAVVTAGQARRQEKRLRELAQHLDGVTAVEVKVLEAAMGRAGRPLS